MSNVNKLILLDRKYKSIERQCYCEPLNLILTIIISKIYLTKKAPFQSGSNIVSLSKNEEITLPKLKTYQFRNTRL